MGRWADRNNSRITDAILELRDNPTEGLRKIQQLADAAAKHDRSDAEVMRRLAEGHKHLAG
uniref:hypothetical protein n=1 Tax=Amycolatopsis sp. CA-151526 TaxID=3239921 RepID=UPI003F497531